MFTLKISILDDKSVQSIYDIVKKFSGYLTMSYYDRQTILYVQNNEVLKLLELVKSLDEYRNSFRNAIYEHNNR